MKELYKPFEYLFYNIENIFKLIGNDGYYHQVAVIIASLQWINILFLGNIISKLLEIEAIMSFSIISYFILVFFNLIYFRESYAIELINRYGNQDKKQEKLTRISSLLYILFSFILLFYSYEIFPTI